VPASPFYPLVETRRVDKLNAEYAAAIAAANWDYAVLLLNAYNDADLLPKAKDIQAGKGAAGLAAATAAADRVFSYDDNNRARRILAYIPLEGQAVPAPVTGPIGMTMGAGGAGVAAGGGTVTSYTNATDPSGTAGWFGLDYQGPDAQKTGWIQFLAREAERFDTDNTSLGFVDTETTASGQAEPRKWSTHDNPYWTIDTFGGAAPFYDAPSTVAVGGGAVGDRGGHETEPAHTMMLDRPDINTTAQKEAFDVGFFDTDPAYVIMRLRFHDYLVRGNQVLYENTITVSWKLASKTDAPARTTTAGAGGTTSKMHNEHYKALVRRFPAWSFYTHG
jgi:hypothetical protein